MQRRKALATAGGITVTAVAATIALGANLGLFGLTNDQSGPGDFAPVSAPAPGPRTEVVDIPVPVTATPHTSVGSEPRPAGDSHSEEAHEHGEPEAHEDD